MQRSAAAAASDVGYALDCIADPSQQRHSVSAHRLIVDHHHDLVEELLQFRSHPGEQFQSIAVLPLGDQVVDLRSDFAREVRQPLLGGVLQQPRIDRSRFVSGSDVRDAVHPASIAAAISS